MRTIRIARTVRTRSPNPPRRPWLGFAGLAALCVLAWLTPTAEAADAGDRGDADWSAGIASVKITPQKPVPLAGYAARTKPFESVDQDLFAKALAVKDAAGNRAVLVTMDLCILPPDVGEGVRDRIVNATRLDRAAVLLNVAHSHSAPAVSLRQSSTTAPATAPSGAPPGQVNPNSQGTVEYTRWLQDRLVEVAEQALGKLEPAKLSWGTGVASFAMNRRQFTDRGVVLGVNPRGLVDRSVPVLRVDDPQGKPRAVLFGYACHNTTNPSSHLGVSGDYTGYAKAYVEKQFPGAQAMFMTGCGGDANPYPREKLEFAPAHGEALGKEVCRVLETKLLPVRGPLSCAAATAELPLLTPDRPTLESLAKTGSSLVKPVAQQMLAALDRGEKLPPTYRAPVAAWQFGNDLTLVALPDEVVVDYAQHLERALGPMRLWVAGYCQEVAGYVPSERVLREGGYETRGLYFGTGWFAPGVEDALVNAARGVAIQAGRKPGQNAGTRVELPGR